MQVEPWQRHERNFKPTNSLAHLETLVKNGQPFSLQNFIEYCHHTISQISKDRKNLKSHIPNISTINNHPVQSKTMPCLIYQHLSQTFCSLVEAYNDGDSELLEAEIKEVMETVGSFMSNQEYGHYECFNRLQVDQGINDQLLKDRLVQRIGDLVDEYQKIAESSSFKGKGKGKKSKKEQLRMIKQRQEKLKKRQQESVKPLLSKLLSRVKKQSEQESKAQKESQQKQFILGQGINKYRQSLCL